jgi:predicted RNA-binding protein YlxR (DUF448 family)
MLADAYIDDKGPQDARGAPERTCVVTRAVKPVGELIRFVIAPDGAVVADLKRRLPGRGVWVTATRAVVDEAVKRKLFAKGFKREARAAPDLGAQVDQQLERAALDSLGIAHKSGRVRTGFAKTEAALADDPVAAVLQASDGSADGERKIAAAISNRQMAGFEGEVPVVKAFTIAQLDLALGRSNVVHAALLAGPASNGFLARCQSLERYRTTSPDGRGRKARDQT